MPKLKVVCEWCGFDFDVADTVSVAMCPNCDEDVDVDRYVNGYLGIPDADKDEGR